MHIILTILLLLPPSLVACITLILVIVTFDPLRLSIVLIMLYSFACLWIVSKKQRKRPAFKLKSTHWLGIILAPFASVGSLYLYTNDQFGTLSHLTYYALAPTLYAGICGWIGWNATTLISNPQLPSKKRLSLIRKTGLLLSYLYFSLCLVLLLISMGDTLLSVGYNAVGDLLIPLNLINWTFLLILASPGFLLRKVSLSTPKALMGYVK